jgi:hypothetical protein
MTIRSLFSRRRASPRIARARRRDRGLSVRSSDAFGALQVESLETRAMLAVSYHGVDWTNTTSNAETFTYLVEVDDQPSAAGVPGGDLYMRYVAADNRIDIDDNQDFSNVVNLRAPERFTVLNPFFGPFSLRAEITVSPQRWNNPGQDESYSSAGFEIRGVGATAVDVYISGDPFPLGLAVFGNVNLITLAGSIDNRIYPTAYDTVDFQANIIRTEAEITTGDVDFFATSDIEIRNPINATFEAYMSDGDFRLIAGSSINGSTQIYMGTDGPNTIGFNGPGGDVLIDGKIVGGNVTIHTTSDSQAVNIKTGPSGYIRGSNTLSLFNSGLDGGVIDIDTQAFAFTTVDVGSPVGPLPDIGISIRQTEGSSMTINSVPRSRGQITLEASAPNARINVNSDINTLGGLALIASDLQVNRPISTTAGNIRLEGDLVSIGSNVSAGLSGLGSIAVKSRTAGISVGSAAVMTAANGTISLDAATSILSQATLDTPLLRLDAGGLITVGSNARELEARAVAGITITGDDDQRIRSAVSTQGTISITTAGVLEVASAATTGGAGNIVLAAGAGLDVNTLRVKQGSALLSSESGSVRINGAVIVESDVGNNLGVTAATGNIIVEPTASLTVADQVSFSAPLGRVYTPGEVVGVEITDAGSGYLVAPGLTFDAGQGATADPLVDNQGVSFIRVLQGGSGYVQPPTVIFTGGTTGQTARATARISNGVVVGIDVTNAGSGYTSAPNITFSGGSGSGAEAIAFIDGVFDVQVTASGSGYLVPPEVVISSGDGATSAAISIDASGGITGINLAFPGSGYGVAPLVEISDSSGSGFGAAASATLAKGVTGYRITGGGSQYTAAPAVTVTAPTGPNGVQAEAQAVIEGFVSGVTLTGNGDFYTTNTTAAVVGDGSGAAVAFDIDGTPFDADVRSGGSGFAAADVVGVETRTSPLNGASFDVRAYLGLTAASLSFNNATQQYFSPPEFIFPSPNGAPAGIARRAEGEFTFDAATGLITGVLITDPGVGYNGTEGAVIFLNTGSRKAEPAGNPWTDPALSIDPSREQFIVTHAEIDNITLAGGWAADPVVSFNSSNGANALVDVSVRGPNDDTIHG